jgi:hypothetical protein
MQALRESMWADTTGIHIFDWQVTPFASAVDCLSFDFGCIVERRDLAIDKR